MITLTWLCIMYIFFCRFLYWLFLYLLNNNAGVHLRPVMQSQNWGRRFSQLVVCCSSHMGVSCRFLLVLQRRRRRNSCLCSSDFAPWQWLILLHLRESSQKKIHHIAAVSPLSNCVCWCWCSSKAYLHSNSRVLKRHGRHWCYLNLISLHCFCDICIVQNGNSFKPQSKLWKGQKIWRPRPFCRVWQGCEEEGTRVWPTCRTNAQV